MFSQFDLIKLDHEKFNLILSKACSRNHNLAITCKTYFIKLGNHFNDSSFLAFLGVAHYCVCISDAKWGNLFLNIYV